MIVRHKLLADLVRLWKNDQLVEKIDRLPIELSPRNASYITGQDFAVDGGALAFGY